MTPDSTTGTMPFATSFDAMDDNGHVEIPHR